MCLALAATGCSGYAGPRTVANPDPAVKIPLIKQAVARHDTSIIPQMIADLCSDDAAIRFYAIDALYRLTGTTRGYCYYADSVSRAPAVSRWKAWLADGEVAQN
jgi:hypothetical protein